ncbi:MAG: prepilin-type N-terminal cleavage/methylation domain-containing protein [Candidatus Omnitrophica bacterium]|nr:prepilin-type N-terminal cleavage/methylation domain-containing protein [Candidatus Omnitrophota bacterium]
MNKKQQHGYTLVEVLMTCVIFVLILESIYTTLWLGQKTWSDYSDNVQLKQNVRWAMVSMSDELREAKNIFIIKDEEKHSITVEFERPAVGLVSYHWAQTGENAYKIIRKNYDHSRVLASYITYLSFDQPLDSEIIIEIADGKDKKYDLKEKIALRTKTSLFIH